MSLKKIMASGFSKFLVITFLTAFLAAPAYGKDGDSGSSGSGNSGSGNSGKGNSGSDDNDDNGDDNDSDDDDNNGSGSNKGSGSAKKDQDRARDAVKSGKAAPLTDLMKHLRKNYPGKILNVDLKRRSDGFIYRVKLLTKAGRLQTLTLNAKTLQRV